jgi:hypothetical protein
MARSLLGTRLRHKGHRHRDISVGRGCAVRKGEVLDGDEAHAQRTPQRAIPVGRGRAVRQDGR